MLFSLSIEVLHTLWLLINHSFVEKSQGNRRFILKANFSYVIDSALKTANNNELNVISKT